MSSDSDGRCARAAKAGLYQVIRNVEVARKAFCLSVNAISYLRLAAESVSAADCAAGNPNYYGRVDETAYKLGITEKTHWNIVKQLCALGLVDLRTLANGHRGARRDLETGELLWAHGVLLTPLLERAEELAALAEQVKAEQRAYATARQRVNNARARLRRVIEAATPPSPSLLELHQQAQAILDAAPSRIRRSEHALDDLLRIGAEMLSVADALQAALAMVVEEAETSGNTNADHQKLPTSTPQISDIKYDTTPLLSSCTMRTPPNGGEEFVPERPNGRKEGLETKPGAADGESNRKITTKRQPPEGGDQGVAVDPNTDLADVTIPKFLRAAPERWREAIEDIQNIDWRVIDMVACVRRAELGVSEHAWKRGVAAMGAGRAALALMILDRNQDHPKRPVRSVGGAFVALTNRFQEGRLDLATSFQGVLHRPQGGSVSAVH